MHAIHTDSLGLDRLLGLGGIPRGRVAEIYGPESFGKTTQSLVPSLGLLRNPCELVDGSVERALLQEHCRIDDTNLKQRLEGRLTDCDITIGRGGFAGLEFGTATEFLSKITIAISLQTPQVSRSFRA